MKQTKSSEIQVTKLMDTGMNRKSESLCVKRSEYAVKVFPTKWTESGKFHWWMPPNTDALVKYTHTSTWTHLHSWICEHMHTHGHVYTQEHVSTQTNTRVHIHIPNSHRLPLRIEKEGVLPQPVLSGLKKQKLTWESDEKSQPIK